MKLDTKKRYAVVSLAGDKAIVIDYNEYNNNSEYDNYILYVGLEYDREEKMWYASVCDDTIEMTDGYYADSNHAVRVLNSYLGF